MQQGTTPWAVTGNVNVSNLTSNVTISNLGNSTIQTSLADGAQLGPFSRLRVSAVNNINDYNTLYGVAGNIVDWNTVAGGSGTRVFNANASTNGLSVTTGSGDYVIYQTKEYHSYTPGCGQLILATGVLAATKPNLTQRIGYFDDLNGIYFERATDGANNTVNSWNIRNNNSNLPVLAQTASQGSWNIDNMNGSGPSGINLDWTKVQIFVIDFQWLGAGRVRCGFDLDGVIYYAHEFLNANNITSTYMSQPSLPVRYEIRNTGTTANASVMTAICSAVQTEGGTTKNAYGHSATNGATGVTCGTTLNGVFAIRLKNRLGPGNKPNRTVAQLQDFTLFGSQAAFYTIVRMSNSTCIAGSPTWTSDDPTSYVEYTTNFTPQNLSGNSIAISNGFISTAQGSAVGSTTALVANKYARAVQNYDSSDSEIIAIIGQRIGNQDSVIYAAMNWLEIK